MYSQCVYRNGYELGSKKNGYSRYSMFTTCSSGLRSFRGMATDLQSMYYKCPHLQAKLQSICLRKRARAARTKYVTPLSLDTGVGPKLKRLQFRASSDIERIQADLKTFAISHGIRTHIDQMTASSCVDNEPGESQMRTFRAQLE
jgi:hypothetical protein